MKRQSLDYGCVWIVCVAIVAVAYVLGVRWRQPDTVKGSITMTLVVDKPEQAAKVLPNLWEYTNR